MVRKQNDLGKDDIKQLSLIHISFTEDGKLCYLYPGREKIFAI